MSKLYNKKTKKRYQNTKGKNKSKNKTMAQRGGGLLDWFTGSTTATDSTTTTDNTSSWFDVFTGTSAKVKEGAASAVNSVEEVAANSFDNVKNETLTGINNAKNSVGSLLDNAKNAVVGPAAPSYSATASNGTTTYGGKTQKHKHKCKKHHKHTATCCNHRKCRK